MTSFKKPFYSALVFFGTLAVLTVGYAAYSLSTESANAPLTSTKWNNVINAVNDLDTRVTSLVAGWGNLWSTGATNTINYSAGNVGIGNTTPSASLDVKRTTADANFAGYIEGTGPDNYGLGVNIANTTSTKAIADFKSGNISRLFVRADGNVGIGNAAPFTRLTLVGNGATTPSLTYNANDIFQFANAIPGVALAGGVDPGTTAFWLQIRSPNASGYNYPLSLNPLGGNVGIGTASPGSKLQVEGTNSDIFVKSSAGAQSTISFQHDAGATYLAHVGTYTQGASNVGLAFAVGNNAITSPSMYIKQNGLVGVGTTDPDTLLTVNGNARATAVLVGATAGGTYLNTTNQGGDPSSRDLTVTAAGSTNSIVLRSSQTIQMYTYYGGWYQERFRITNPGNATLAGTLTQNSDVRLKKEITPIGSSLEKISELNGVTYNWKDSTRDSRRQIGVIAQDVEKVFPEAVVTDEKGIKSVAYGNLVAPLIEAVKELKKENDSLKKENQDIKSLLCLDHPTASICK